MAKTSQKDIEFLKALKAALELRAAGVPYSEIIEKVPHWRSIQACQKAVASSLAKDFNNSIEAARNEIIARKEKQLFMLMEKFNKNGSVIISREIVRIDDQIAKLKGLYAPTKIAETDKDGNDKPKVIVYLPENNRDK